MDGIVNTNKVKNTDNVKNTANVKKPKAVVLGNVLCIYLKCTKFGVYKIWRLANIKLFILRFVMS